jgi:hypothetical protein
MKDTTCNGPNVTWSNGDTMTAPTWEALEQRVRKVQWHRYAPDDFREAMAKRAWRWSGTRVDVYGTSEEFFIELERAQLVVIAR